MDYAGETKGAWDSFRWEIFNRAHITDRRRIVIKTPIGTMDSWELNNKEVRLYEKIVEEEMIDYDNDIAIYGLPKDLQIPEFPCKPNTEINLGDEIYVIGNPIFAGTNIRRGYISDLDMAEGEELT